MARVTQLVYHPAFDPYNTMLRACRILLSCPDGLDPMALRILEFYLLFPEELGDVRLTTELRSVVRRLDARPRYPYDRLPASRTVFDRMGTAFDAALQTMTSRGLVKAQGAPSRLRLVTELVPAAILDLASEQNKNEMPLMSALAGLAAVFPTAGENGLKDRSGLAEFRYDVV